MTATRKLQAVACAGVLVLLAGGCTLSAARARETSGAPAPATPTIAIPAGCFSMGSTNGDADEAPIHRVCLDGFEMDELEVTNAQYAQCVRAGACASVEAVQASYQGGPYDGPRQPVVAVTWYDARDYCRFVGARLPTEAEWEYAARGTDGREYPWGNELDCRTANWGVHPDWQACTTPSFCARAFECKGINPGRPADVGTYPADVSPFGVHDLGGNVIEWVADWYAPDSYAHSPERNPTGPPSGTEKIVRGGSWFLPPHTIRAADRGKDTPGPTKWPGWPRGFRCARDRPSHSLTGTPAEFGRCSGCDYLGGICVNF